MHINKKIVIGSVLTLVVVMSPTKLPQAMSIAASVAIAEAPLAPVVVPPAPPAPDKLDLWLNKLINKESSGKAHIKILDVNGRYSYGCLQFQMATFLSYAGRYGIKVTPEDIYSCDLQKKIAKSMILESNSNWRHWWTSVTQKGIGYPPKLSAS